VGTSGSLPPAFGIGFKRHSVDAFPTACCLADPRTGAGHVLRAWRFRFVRHPFQPKYFAVFLQQDRPACCIGEKFGKGATLWDGDFLYWFIPPGTKIIAYSGNSAYNTPRSLLMFPLSFVCSIGAVAPALLADALRSTPDPILALLPGALCNTPGAWHEPARGFSDTNPFGMPVAGPGSCSSTAGLPYEIGLDSSDTVCAAWHCVLCGAAGGSADCTRVFPLCVVGSMPGCTAEAFPPWEELTGAVVADPRLCDLRESHPVCCLWLRLS
jgi:hypothetical protein